LARVAGPSEEDCERQHALGRSLLGDLGVVGRWVLLVSLATRLRRPARFLLLGVTVDNVTQAQAVDRIADAARRERPLRVSFVNADCMNQVQSDPGYGRTLEESDLVLPDGSGVRLAARLTGVEVRENVNGTDLFPDLCRRLEEERLSLYLIGAAPGIVDQVAGWIRDNHPELPLAGWEHGFLRPGQDAAAAARIRASGARVVLVAMGAPRQELWISRWSRLAGSPVMIGVGGLFDFFSGQIPRAPRWMRELGLEWCYRLWQEPGRLAHRYLLGNPLFLVRSLRGALTGVRLRPAEVTA
jgi:N-acetylglucosaminyldiphosphoundecaprenol N-acetyl-beta-D-mannosaminyltransferase